MAGPRVGGAVSSKYRLGRSVLFLPPLVEKMEVLRNYEVPGTSPPFFPTICLLD